MFVGNLELTINEGDILKIFGKFGSVTACAFLHHFTGPMRGKPRGFCFVEMRTHAEAQGAIDALNGRRLRGRELRVNFAKDDHESALVVAPELRANQKGGATREDLTASDKASTYDERLLERRSQLVKMTLERLGATVPPPTATAPAPEASPEAAPEATSEAAPEAAPEEEVGNVVAAILGSDSE